MPSTPALVRTAQGLFTQYNRLHELREGAVLVARNLAMYQDGCYGPRRGFKRYGAQFQPEWLYEFDGRLLGLEGTTLKYDSDGYGTWSAWSGSWSPPESGIRLRAIQARTALYLSTSLGVYYTEALATAPIRAGLATALDCQLSRYGTGNGWFDPGYQVGYRIVWGRLTPYGTLQLGAPSMREAILNAWTSCTMAAAGTTVTVTQTAHGYSTGDYIETSDLSDPKFTPSTGQITVTGNDTYTYTTAEAPPATGTGKYARKENVRVTFSCPEDLQYGDFWEIYRTNYSASESDDPADEQLRVARGIISDNAVSAASVTLAGSGTTVTVTLAAHGLTAGDVVTLSDLSDSGFEAGAHEVTSVATDTFTYSTASTAPASGTGKCRYLTVTHIDGLDPAFISDPLYTNVSREGIEQANTRPPWSKAMCQWKNRLWCGNTKREHYLDLFMVDIDGITAETSSLTLTLGASSETYVFSASTNYQTRKFLKDTTSSTEAVKIRNTMKAFCAMVNRTSAYFYAWYTSGIEEAPGMVTIETRDLNTAAFSLTCNSTATGNCFEPGIPTTGTTYLSDESRLLNGVSWSKPDAPHAVPDSNFEENLGDPSKEILALVPTRDSIMVIKEDGVFRISGDSDRTFTFKPLDLTVFGRAPETWRALDNAVWGLSSKGLMRVTESGVQEISAPVADDIERIFLNPSADSLCHAAGYESEGLYLLFSPETVSDTACKVIWAFPTDGLRGPTKWHRSAQAAHILFGQQKLYWSSADSDDHVFEERKDLTYTDHVDEELECTVSEVSTYSDPALGTLTRVRVLFPVTGTLNTDMVPAAGDLFRKTPSSLPHSKIRRLEVVATETYDLYLSHYFQGLDTGTGTISRAIDTELQWPPECAGSAAILKDFAELQLYFAEATVTRAKFRFRSDVVESSEEHEIIYDAKLDNVLRVPVPAGQALGRAIDVMFLHRVGHEAWSLLERAIILKPTTYTTSDLPL